MEEWDTWKPQFLAFVARKRSSTTGVPWTYLLRSKVVPEEADLDGPYSSIDEDLVATTVLIGTQFERDNRSLWDEMMPLFVNGPLWSSISAYQDTKNARDCLEHSHLSDIVTFRCLDSHEVDKNDEQKLNAELESI